MRQRNAPTRPVVSHNILGFLETPSSRQPTMMFLVKVVSIMVVTVGPERA
jgi:hypothetical protein